MMGHSFFSSLTFPEHLVGTSTFAANQQSWETPTNPLSKDVEWATERHGRGYRSSVYLPSVTNDHFKTEVKKPEVDLPQWLAAWVPSCSFEPSDRQEEGTLLPSERLGGRGSGFCKAATARYVYKPDQSPVYGDIFLHVKAQATL
jgi:hypothetical protein